MDEKLELYGQLLKDTQNVCTTDRRNADEVFQEAMKEKKNREY